PRECTAQIIVAPDEAAAVKASIEQAAAEIAEEFKASDPDLKLTVSEETDCSESAISAKDSARVIALIEALPNGIIRMSREIDKLVETSLNLGVLKSDDAAVTLRYAVRSSVGVAKKSLKNQLVCIAGAFAAEVTFEGDYPAWEYKKDSKLREDMVRIFEEMYGKKPTVEAIHAGVECGLLSGKIEGLDCISMGPDMYDIHTTEERLSISSAKRSYEYILRVIACK
ncbi:MAG: M20/M25/M40 family metallo-hydrolase, partial [Agathobacter sp.]|nr:M20/M25/M40 family metallo-hydrolase [Agathobacter sp.]